MPENQTDYNIVTLKNIDDEDFIFAVDKVQYVIPAGEVRRFPKFMATLAYKHLLDKLLIKENPEGKFLANQKKRDDLGAKILIGEEAYEQPKVPTDAEIIEEMNKPSEIDRLLEKNRGRLKAEEPPVVTTEDDKVIPEPEVELDKFDGLETGSDEEIILEKKDGKLPSREEMIKYARDVLLMNVDHHMTKKKLANLSDQELFDELQMDI